MQYSRQYTKQQYDEAVSQISKKLERDKNVLAIFWLDATNENGVWEKPGIDFIIVVEDNKPSLIGCTFSQGAIDLHANVVVRSVYTKESSLQIGSDLIASSHILYMADETLADYNMVEKRLGEEDNRKQFLIYGCEACRLIEKAWFQLCEKKDVTGCFCTISQMYTYLAGIELALRNEPLTRNAIDIALQYNAKFFQEIYIDLVKGAINKQVLENALYAIEAYINTYQSRIFEYILRYLKEANRFITLSELAAYCQRWATSEKLAMVCDRLQQSGFLMKGSAVFNLTKKSKISLDEPAYYYTEVNNVH